MFDIETVIEEQPPLWIPRGDGRPDDRLAVWEVKALIRRDLEEADRERELAQRGEPGTQELGK